MVNQLVRMTLDMSTMWTDSLRPLPSLAEHHVLYQYSLIGARDHYLGLIQTETVRLEIYTLHLFEHWILSTQPYFQPEPAAPAPFPINFLYDDPSYFDGGSAWGLWVQSSNDIIVYGEIHIKHYQKSSIMMVFFCRQGQDFTVSSRLVVSVDILPPNLI